MKPQKGERYFRGIRPGLIEAGPSSCGTWHPKLGISGASAPASLKLLNQHGNCLAREGVFPGHPPRPH